MKWDDHTNRFKKLLSFLLLTCLASKLVSGAVILRVGEDEAFTSIQSAIDSIPTEVTKPYIVSVREGTYLENIVLSGKKTSSRNSISIVGNPGGPSQPVMLRPADVEEPVIKLETQNHVTIENFDIGGSRSYGNVFLFKSDRNTIENCTIHNNARFDGITLSGSRFNVIENNDIRGNNRAGIFLVNTSVGNTIRFNKIYRNRMGIQASSKYSSHPIHANWNVYQSNSDRNTVGLEPGPDSIERDPDLDARGEAVEGQDSASIRWGRNGAATVYSPEAYDRGRGGAPEGWAFIDLSPFANRSLVDETPGDRKGGWTDQGTVDLRHAPLGVQTFHGIPFKMPGDKRSESVLILEGMNTPAFPASVKDIPVDRHAQSLTFLHASAWAVSPDVMKYVVHYADGTSVEIPIERPVEIGDWFNPEAEGETRVAWSDFHPMHPEIKLGLYAYTWENPYPHLELAAVDIISSGKSTPIIAAITARNVEATQSLKVNVAVDPKPAQSGQPVSIAVDCVSLTPGEAIVTVKIFDERGEQQTALEPSTLQLVNGLSEKAEFTWQPPKQASSETYRLDVTVSAGDTTLGGTRDFLRVTGRTPLAMPPPVLETDFVGDQKLGGSNLFYSCEIQPRKRAQIGKKAERIDPIIFDQLKENGGTVAHLIFWWRYLEPRPYEYDFSDIEWALEQCRRVGLEASISVWMGDHAVPLFVADETMLDQFGNPILNGRGRNKPYSIHPSIWGEKTREHFGALIRTVCETYLENDTVTAWAFHHLHIEVVIHDRKGTPPILYDYSEPSQKAYKRYLKDHRGWTLEDLNEKYATAYGGWEEVRQPAPRPGLDVSPAWSDFQDFRIWSAREAYRYTFEAVREIDPTGEKRLWAFNPKFSENVCIEYNAITNYSSAELPIHLDGFHASRLLGDHSMMVEPMTIPPGVFEISSGFFNTLSAPAQGYFWVGTRNHLFDPKTEAAQLFKEYRDAWVELSDAKRIPSEIAVLKSEDTALAVDKVFFAHSRFWLGSNYDSLIKNLQSGSFQYQPVYSSHFDMLGGELPNRYELIIDSDSKVMREGLIEELIEQVRSGAVLLMQPETGRYCRENPAPEASLAYRLGWTKATGMDWVPTQDKLQVQTQEGGKLFGGASLKFMERYPIERLESGELVLSEAGLPVARVLNLGQGKVILLAGDIDWKASEQQKTLEALCRYSEVQNPIQSGSGSRANLLVKGDHTYVLLYNEKAVDFLQTSFAADIGSGTFQVTNVTDSMSDAGLISGREVKDGYPVVLAPWEFRVYRLTKMDGAQ